MTRVRTIALAAALAAALGVPACSDDGGGSPAATSARPATTTTAAETAPTSSTAPGPTASTSTTVPPRGCEVNAGVPADPPVALPVRLPEGAVALFQSDFSTDPGLNEVSEGGATVELVGGQLCIKTTRAGLTTVKIPAPGVEERRNVAVSFDVTLARGAPRSLGVQCFKRVVDGDVKGYTLVGYSPTRGRIVLTSFLDEPPRGHERSRRVEDEMPALTLKQHFIAAHVDTGCLRGGITALEIPVHMNVNGRAVVRRPFSATDGGEVAIYVDGPAGVEVLVDNLVVRAG